GYRAVERAENGAAYPSAPSARREQPGRAAPYHLEAPQPVGVEGLGRAGARQDGQRGGAAQAHLRQARRRAGAGETARRSRAAGARGRRSQASRRGSATSGGNRTAAPRRERKAPGREGRARARAASA